MWLSWRIINFLKEKKNGKGGRYLENVEYCVREGIKKDKKKECKIETGLFGNGQTQMRKMSEVLGS